MCMAICDMDDLDDLSYAKFQMGARLHHAGRGFGYVSFWFDILRELQTEKNGNDSGSCGDPRISYQTSRSAT